MRFDNVESVRVVPLKLVYSMLNINICICTYNRIPLLQECLDSIGSIVVPESCNVNVLVVDNDSECSSMRVVDSSRANFPFRVKYICEPRKGIPCARNRAILETLEMSSDYLVFVDDDETVDSQWLASLVSMGLKLGPKAVIHGRVIPEIKVQVKPEIGGLFGRKVHETGSMLDCCATDNVLIPAYVYRHLGLRFDETKPLAGGTDTKYFVEAISKGVLIFQCKEAVVYESIPENRLSIWWLARRKFRSGLTDAWKKRRQGRKPFRIALSAITRIMIELIKSIVMGIVGNKLERN